MLLERNSMSRYCLTTGLHPMFALIRQVQVACDQVKNGAARLAGIDPPKFEDNETSIDQLRSGLLERLCF